ncbi:hypothetical protein B0H16DRAFT_1461319 [Mycena metata]|uniref:Uncharacterized protein n=1 Tax=Mycena metata TaxID=1033252 RepID=A0AAD7IRU4_9AGAR|nr:hypothetical protein B0H16DRAFT_1461319 [Mycena metata]
MPGMKSHSIIFSILYDPDSNYPACQALFSPDDTYRTQSLAAHECEPKTEYFLVTNKHEACVYQYSFTSRLRGPVRCRFGYAGGVIVSAEGHFFRDNSEVNAALRNSRLQIKMFRNVTSACEWFMGLPPAKEEDEDGQEDKAFKQAEIHIEALKCHGKPTSATLQAWLEHYNASPPAADIHEQRRNAVIARVAARQRALERRGWPPVPCHPNHPENRRVVEEERKQKERKAVAEREKQAAAAKALVDELMEL